MKNKYIAFIAAVLLTIISHSCNSTRETNTAQMFSEIPEHIREGVTRTRQEIFQIGLIMADDEELLTDDQFNLLKNMMSITKTSIVLDSNKILNTSTPEDFERLGISIYHYYILKEDIAGINKAILCEEFGVEAKEVYSELMKSIDEFFERNKTRISADF